MSIRSDLLRFVETRPGQAVWVADLEEEFSDLTKRQIQTAMWYNSQHHGVTSLIDGQKWRWDNQEANKISEFGFTIIGESKTGTVVLEDATGELWRATKI